LLASFKNRIFKKQLSKATFYTCNVAEHIIPRDRSRWSTNWKNRMMDPEEQGEWRQLYLSRAKLKAVSRTSALIAGFAMVAMVEVQLSKTDNQPQVLLVAFSVVTTLLVTVHLFALMISTCMLPNIEAISSFHHNNAIKSSPHKRMRMYVEVAWILSTGVGLVLFLVEIALLIWLKFMPFTITADNQNVAETTTNPPVTTPTIQVSGIHRNLPAWSATIILIPVVIIFAYFAIHFYVTLNKHRFNVMSGRMQDLERQKALLEALPLEIHHGEQANMLEANSNGLTRSHSRHSRHSSGMSNFHNA